MSDLDPEREMRADLERLLLLSVDPASGSPGTVASADADALADLAECLVVRADELRSSAIALRRAAAALRAQGVPPATG